MGAIRVVSCSDEVDCPVAETIVPQAYDAFLQGWDHYRRETKEDTTKAITFFEQAIKLDPGYSRAYAGLAAANGELLRSTGNQQ